MPFSAKCIEALDQSEGPFPRLVNLTASLFQCQAAIISLLTPNEAVLRSNAELCTHRVPREDSLAVPLMQMGPGAVLVVPDLKQDERFRQHSLVTGTAEARFFAGATLYGPERDPIGALILLDQRPDLNFGPGQIEQLRLLAGMADDMIAGIEAARIRDERLDSLKLVEQMSGIGSWRLDRNTGAMDWSDAVYRILGLDNDKQSISLEGAVSYVDEEDRERIYAQVQRILEKGEGFVAQMRLHRADGQVRDVEMRAKAEVDDRNRVTGAYGVMQDITEQGALLAQVQRSEARYRLLAENVGDVLTRVKTDGSSKYISPAIQPLLGWTYEDMSGQSMDYVYPDDRPMVQSAIRKAVKTGEPIMLEHRALHRDGHAVWVECTFRAVRGETGLLDDVIVVIRDISRRKSLEDEVIVAKERAEKAAAAKSEFLANMSHELRTPLTSVIGFSGLLASSQVLPEQERVYAERIATASEALLEVINDILDYSKLEADAIELDPVVFDPRILIEGAAAIVEGQCVIKGLDLAVRFAEGLPPGLKGDLGRLRQVTLNFLSNAVKFTSKGGVRLEATGESLEDGRWALRVAVTDTGIGIASDHLALLFERFTQADASTTRLYGGTGLGLAISRRLVEKMGGQIGVESQPGEGSTFWFEVPLEQAERVNPGQGVQHSMKGVEGLGRARILLADDASANRELMTAILSSLGLEVHTVKDGAEAVQAIQAGSYDLVLMDVHMPVMDGLAATQEIRRIQAGGGRRTPILALTANVQADQVKRCLDCGMDGHLAKPVQIPELGTALARWLTPSGAVLEPNRIAEGG